MSWFKKTVGTVVSLFVVVVAVGLILPSQVHVEREITIDTRPHKIYPLIANFQRWHKWSPWATIDPDADFKIIGRGVKQKMFWSSEDPRVGNGSQEFVALNKPTQVRTRLDFGEQRMADASFDLISESDRTKVIWSMDTDIRAGVPLYMKPFAAYLGLFMDSLVGKDYERGLENLQELVRG